MILQTTALLLALGLVVFVLGHFTGNPGLAMIGAIIVIGVGATGMVDGIEVRDGQVETVNETTNETMIEYTYRPIGSVSGFPVPEVITILGAVGLISGAGRASEEDYT